MQSIGSKIKQITGLLGTDDLTEWEGNFVQNIKNTSGDGARTTHLTSKQVEIVERIHSKHFVEQ